MTQKKNLEEADLFVKVFDSLKSESDRGCVLVVASLIENILEEQIVARLSPKIGKSDELLSKASNSAISSFSSKINLAYRLGLIPLSERAIYHQLRELRNVCAHHVEQQNFEQNHFKDRTKNIISESSIIWEIFKEKVVITANKEIKSVEDYVNSIGWRTAFQLFFSLIIAFKKPATTRITRIAPLYDPALDPS